MNEELPEPLVPAEVDLRGLGGFMLRTDRLLSSELIVLGDPEECWAAVLLWCRAWQQQPAASLPNDERVLASFSGAGKRWPRIRAMAMRGFVLCSDNRWYHRVLAEEALEAWARRVKFRERSDKANRAKRAAQQGDLIDGQQGEPQGIQQGVLEGHEGKGRGSEGKGNKQQPLRGLSGKAPDAPEPGRKNGHDHASTKALRAQAIEVLGFLNEKTARNYQPVPANVDMIVARLKQGATVEDCRAVVAKKCREWAADEKMAPYLRPATLFNATKFAQYQGEIAPAEAQ